MNLAPNKQELIDQIKDMPTHLDMIKFLEEEAYRVERMRGFRNNKDAYKHEQLHGYYRSIGGLLWFFRTGIYPSGWDDIEGAVYKPLFNHLVKRGMFGSEILNNLSRTS